MTENDGGPAFPRSFTTIKGANKELIEEFYPGMTLRDWFAGVACQGLVGEWLATESDSNEFAEQCYKIADAMLKEREK